MRNSLYSSLPFMRGGGVQTSLEVIHSKLPEGSSVSGTKSIQRLYSDRKQRDIQPTVKYP